LEDYQLAMVSLMYFENGISQQEIAGKLNLSKMTVSRFLQKARDKQIVEINVRLPFLLDDKLSDALVKEYDIKRAVVIKRKTGDYKRISELIGRVWAFYCNLTLKNDYLLGLGLGNTIGYTIRYLVPMNIKNVHIVQLMGGLTDVTYMNPFTIVQETCRKLKAQGTYVTSSVIVENKGLKDSIINDMNTGKRVVDMWSKCDEALFGIGTIGMGTFFSSKFVKSEEADQIVKLGAVGDIMGHFFIEGGEFISTHLNDRLVNIPLELLKKIPERVAVAGGEEKTTAIKGALLSGIVTTLVTDDQTAQLLVEKRGDGSDFIDNVSD
jgi:deoxyribonucleoside regulator